MHFQRSDMKRTLPPHCSVTFIVAEWPIALVTIELMLAGLNFCGYTLNTMCRSVYRDDLCRDDLCRDDLCRDDLCKG